MYVVFITPNSRHVSVKNGSFRVPGVRARGSFPVRPVFRRGRKNPSCAPVLRVWTCPEHELLRSPLDVGGESHPQTRLWADVRTTEQARTGAVRSASSQAENTWPEMLVSDTTKRLTPSMHSHLHSEEEQGRGKAMLLPCHARPHGVSRCLSSRSLSLRPNASSAPLRSSFAQARSPSAVRTPSIEVEHDTLPRRL